MINLFIKNVSWSPWCPGLDSEVSDVAKRPFISYSVSFLKMDSGALGAQGWILRSGDGPEPIHFLGNSFKELILEPWVHRAEFSFF